MLGAAWSVSGTRQKAVGEPYARRYNENFVMVMVMVIVMMMVMLLTMVDGNPLRRVASYTVLVHHSQYNETRDCCM